MVVIQFPFKQRKHCGVVIVQNLHVLLQLVEYDDSDEHLLESQFDM